MGILPRLVNFATIRPAIKTLKNVSAMAKTKADDDVPGCVAGVRQRQIASPELIKHSQYA